MKNKRSKRRLRGKVRRDKQLIFSNVFNYIRDIENDIGFWSSYCSLNK